MAVRIRVYPQNGMYGGLGGVGGAYGRYGGLAHVQLQNEKKTGNLRLQYERALWAERLKTVQLQTAMQYGGAAGVGGAMPLAMANPYALGAYGVGGALTAPGMLAGAIPPGFGGSGQSNVTSQTGSGAQTVANTNHYSNVVWNQTPAFGYGFPFGGGGGGFLSGLLGALI